MSSGSQVGLLYTRCPSGQSHQRRSTVCGAARGLWVGRGLPAVSWPELERSGGRKAGRGAAWVGPCARASRGPCDAALWVVFHGQRVTYAAVGWGARARLRRVQCGRGTGTGCAGRLIPSASTGRGDRKAAAAGALKAAASGVLLGCKAPVGWRVLGRCALLSGSSLCVLRPSCVWPCHNFPPTLYRVVVLVVLFPFTGTACV